MYKIGTRKIRGNSMKEICCTKCNQELLMATESGGDEIFRLYIICTCGKKNVESFLGYPKLMSNDKLYFEYVDDITIECKKKKVKE